MTRISELTLETEETVTLKQGGYFRTEYCPRCVETVDLVSPDLLSLFGAVTEREIFRLVEAGSIHFLEGARIVVCPRRYRRLIAAISVE